jgi:hypothetical protein
MKVTDIFALGLFLSTLAVVTYDIATRAKERDRGTWIETRVKCGEVMKVVILNGGYPNGESAQRAEDGKPWQVRLWRTDRHRAVGTDGDIILGFNTFEEASLKGAEILDNACEL